MNICILADRIPPESGGGAERIAWQAAVGLAQRHHHVSVITTTARPITGIEEEILESVHIYTIHSAYHERWRGWRSLYNPPTVRVVAQILKKIRPEVVHAHAIHYHLSYYTLRLAKRYGAKVFFTAHDVMPFHYGKLVEFIDPKNPVCKKEWNYRVSAWQQIKRFKRWYNPIRNPFIRRSIRALDGFFAVSDALREALRQNGLPGAIVLYNGIAAEKWVASETAVAAFREKFNLTNKKVVFFGGRMNRMKGGEVMLDALEEVVARVPSALLLIASTRDAYVQSLERRAVERGIGAQVASTGWLAGEELRAAYHVADVVVVPSVCFDSFPTMNLEAMASGAPSVATCFGGSREQVVDGETGYIVNPYDTTTLAERLVDLLTHNEKRQAFGAGAHARIEKEFSLEHHLVSLERYYAGLKR